MTDWRSSARAAALRVGAVVVGVILSAVILVPFGYGVGDTLSTLLDGAVGSSAAIEQTLLKTVPLALCGLAVALPLRMRLWNIGAEGQFVMGAVGATAVALNAPDLPGELLIPAMMAGAMIAGGAWALIAAFPRAWWGVSEIITTLLLNYVALLLLTYLVTGPWLGEAGYGLPETVAFSANTVLPRFGDVLHLGLVFPLVAALVLAFALRRTKLGLEIRVIGASPEAATAAGMSIKRTLLVVMFSGGALAGLAGMVEVVMSFGKLQQGVSPGYGYMAIVVATLAAAAIAPTLVVAFVFAGFIVGGYSLQILGVPQAFTLVLQGVILFCALGGAWLAERRRPPHARRGLRRDEPVAAPERVRLDTVVP